MFSKIKIGLPLTVENLPVYSLVGVIVCSMKKPQIKIVMFTWVLD